MGRILTSTFGLLALTLLASAPVAAQSNTGGLRSDERNEKQVRELYAEFEKAWNAHDVDTLAGMWALDGDHQEPDGRVARQRPQIRALLTKQHETVFKNTKLALKIENVWFMTGDVVLVDGLYEISGIVAPDGTALPPRSGKLTSVLMKEQGRWWIAASRLMIPAPLPWRPEA